MLCLLCIELCLIALFPNHPVTDALSSIRQVMLGSDRGIYRMVATTLSVSQTVYNPTSPLFSLKGIKQLCYSPQQLIMTRVLLTGGSGFIAAHILDVLLQRGHSIVTTVRSQDKAKKIKEAYPNIPENRLSFAIVEDIAQEGAFEKAVISDPPFEAVIHTASPYHFDVTDVQKVS
jgi:hypothetical protein